MEITTRAQVETTVQSGATAQAARTRPDTDTVPLRNF